jgi:hypothetical protein
MSEVHIEYSSNVSFAPFNGGYPDHAKHLAKAKLNIEQNLWYDIFDHNDPAKTREHWSLIDPSQYEEPWFPAGLCDRAIPLTQAGSVQRTYEESGMESYGASQLRADAEAVNAAVAAPPPPAELSLPPQHDASVPPPLPPVPAETTAEVVTGPKIAVIGKGQVGIALGKRFLEAGWQLKFGSRTPTNEVPEGDLTYIYYSVFVYLSSHSLPPSLLFFKSVTQQCLLVRSGCNPSPPPPLLRQPTGPA